MLDRAERIGITHVRFPVLESGGMWQTVPLAQIVCCCNAIQVAGSTKPAYFVEFWLGTKEVCRVSAEVYADIHKMLAHSKPL
jgi:hypothetical protein